MAVVLNQLSHVDVRERTLIGWPHLGGTSGTRIGSFDLARTEHGTD